MEESISREEALKWAVTWLINLDYYIHERKWYKNTKEDILKCLKKHEGEGYHGGSVYTLFDGWFQFGTKGLDLKDNRPEPFYHFTFNELAKAYVEYEEARLYVRYPFLL